MKTRPLAVLALGSLLAASTAAADRRRSIGRTIDRDDRAARTRDRDDGDDRDARAEARRKRAERRRTADLEERDSDGPEAQAVYALKLDDLIETSVRLAPDLARAKADRAIAKGNAGAARRNQSWVLGANASYAINAVSREVEVAPFSSVREDTASAAVTLGRNLPTGGNFAVEVGLTRVGRELSIPQEYLDAINAGAAQPDPSRDEFLTTHQAIAKLTFTQPLARGLGPDVALAQEKKADLEATAATISTQLEAEKMIYGLVAGYWELAYCAYQVDVRHDALALAEAQEKATRDQIRAGTAPSTSLNAVIYEISARRDAVLEAELELEKKSLELRRKAGLELDARQIALRPADAFEIGRDEWDVDEVLARSHQANRRLATLALQRRIADVEVAVAKNAMLPQVDLQLSGGVLGTGNTQDAAFSGAGAVNGYQVMAGIAVQFEISGAARSAHDAARARKARVEVDRADALRTLDTEVVAAVKMVTAARERVGLADKAIAVAEDNAAAERQSFAAQRSDNFRVMERQTQLVEARLRRGRAVADYHTAVAQLQYLSGMLLDQYRVDVRPRGR